MAKALKKDVRGATNLSIHPKIKDEIRTMLDPDENLSRLVEALLKKEIKERGAKRRS